VAGLHLTCATHESWSCPNKKGQLDSLCNIPAVSAETAAHNSQQTSWPNFCRLLNSAARSVRNRSHRMMTSRQRMILGRSVGLIGRASRADSHGRAFPLVLQVNQMTCALLVLRCSRLAAVAAVALLLSGTSQEAFGQLTIPPAPAAVPDPVGLGQVVVQSPELAVSPGYWIVSTEASPQKFDRSPPVFCPRLTRFDQGAGYRSSDMSELSNSIVPGIPVCVVVHGSFMDTPSVYPDSYKTWCWLKNACPDRPFQMIYFSWPSDQSLTAMINIDILILGSRASRNGFYLASLMQHLPSESPVSLVGHSHGTRVISSALHLMAGGVVEGYRHPARCSGRRIRCVFAAAAIDHDWLNPGQEYDRALCCTECVLNLKNCKDAALTLYPLRRIGSSRALGTTGFTPKDRARLQGWSGKCVDLDLSSSIGHRHLWPEFYNRPWIARKISNYVFFPDVHVP
jgi:hypothetical protein